MKRKVKNTIMIGMIILCIIGIILVIYYNRSTSKFDGNLAYFTNINDTLIIDEPEPVKVNNYYNIYIISFNIILSLNVVHLCLSKFNYKTVKKTYNKFYKLILLIIISVLSAVALTIVENLLI